MPLASWLTHPCLRNCLRRRRPLRPSLLHPLHHLRRHQQFRRSRQGRMSPCLRRHRVSTTAAAAWRGRSRLCTRGSARSTMASANLRDRAHLRRLDHLWDVLRVQPATSHLKSISYVDVAASGICASTAGTSRCLWRRTVLLVRALPRPSIHARAAATGRHGPWPPWAGYHCTDHCGLQVEPWSFCSRVLCSDTHRCRARWPRR